MSDAFGGSTSKQTSTQKSNSNSQYTSGSTGAQIGTSTSDSTSLGLQGSQQTSSSFDLTPEQYAALRDPISSFLTSFTGNNPFNPQGGSFGGGGASGDWAQYGADNLAAGETDNEKLIRSLLMGDATGNDRQPYLNDVISGKYTDPNSNPFLNDYIKAAQRSTLEGLTETLDRTLPSRFTQAGQFVQPQGSSAFDRAAAIATRGAANAIGDIATNIGYNAYAKERDLQQSAVPLSQQEVQTTISNLQAQALPRLIQQYGIDAGLKEFQNRMSSVLDALKIAAGLSAPTVGNESQGTSFGYNEGQSSSQSAQLGLDTSAAQGTSTSTSKGSSTGTSETNPNIIGTLLSPFSFGITR